jgi:hypothetical protein
MTQIPVFTEGREASESPFDDTWLCAQGSSEDLKPGDPPKTIIEARNRYNVTNMITVAASSYLRPDSFDAINARTRPFLLVRFGGGGVTQECFVDVAAGLLFAVPCDSIEVIGNYPAGEGPPIKLSAQLALGSRPGTGQSSPSVTFTDGPYDLADSAPILVRIPPFARAVTLLLSDAVPLQNGSYTSIEIAVISDAARNLGTSFLLGAGNFVTYPQSVPIFGWGNFIKVTATGGPPSQKVFLLYELSL